jgi:uncharacterized cupredoxin-like copper-binding protein
MPNSRILRNRALLGATAIALLAGGVTACSSGDSGIEVVLSEWIVEPDPMSADAGDVTFDADNQGGEVHEFVVVRAKSAADLPTDEDGSVVEDELPSDALAGEIEDIEAGSTKSLTLELGAGDFVLFCNITEVEPSGEVESHFAEGMYSTFTVN